MIEELIVTNVGSIKKAKLEFTGNFIAITGESGSGKSSLLKALEFITGQRAQSNLINVEADACDVIMTYSSDESETEDIIVKRKFNKAGKGRASVQDEPVPATSLHDLLLNEIVIQNQFAQLNLMDPKKQLSILDSSAQNKGLSEKLESLSSLLKELMKKGKEILSIREKQKQLEHKYQNSDSLLHEIKKLNLTAESEETLNNELKDLDLKAKKIKRIEALINTLSSSHEDGFISRAENIANLSLGLDFENATEIKDLSEEILSSSQRLYELLQNYSKQYSSFTSIDELKDELEVKLGKIRKLKRTLKAETCGELIEYYNNASGEILWFKESFKELSKLEEDSSHLKQEIASLALKIREQRKKLAIELSGKVNKYLQEMDMGYSHFSIYFEELDRITFSGAENISFEISIKDQQPLPIHKNASGGELSRILLALQLSLNDKLLPKTIFFDEVEAGLGGKTALLAGYKLKELSEKCRTILITHEATIAAMADQHFVVKKGTEGSSVKEITDVDREKEIARMLSGDETSAEALAHAKALLS